MVHVQHGQLLVLLPNDDEQRVNVVEELRQEVHADAVVQGLVHRRVRRQGKVDAERVEDHIKHHGHAEEGGVHREGHLFCVQECREGGSVRHESESESESEGGVGNHEEKEEESEATAAAAAAARPASRPASRPAPFHHCHTLPQSGLPQSACLTHSPARGCKPA